MNMHNKISIDNTSSVPVVLPQNKGKRRRMPDNKPFEVRYKKVIIGCDTAEDAAKVARELGDAADSPVSNPWRLDEFLEFVNRIQYQQRRLLAALLRTPQHEVMPDYQLRGALGLSSNQGLAGVLSGITKVAQSMDIDPKRIYGQSTKYKQGSPERSYWLTPAFRQIAEDADWPSMHDLEEPEDERR